MNDTTSSVPISLGGAVPAPSESGPPAGGPAGRDSKRGPFFTGDMPFVIRRDGTWLYRGSAIQRKELVCLFASVLRRDAEGAWWLRTPAEHGRIEVEDAPFIAVELDWSGAGRQQVLSFRTNTDQVVTAGPNHPLRVAERVVG